MSHLKDVIYSINKAGIDLIKKWEGLSLTSYPDPMSELAKACRKAGINPKLYFRLPEWKKLSGKPWTIGYGETKWVHPGQVTTLQEAEIALEQRLVVFEEDVRGICIALHFQPNSNQFSAMVCFAYNLGTDDLYNLVVKSKLDQQDLASLKRFASGMLEYCHSNGHLVAGLLARRKEEAALFLN